MNVVVYTAVFGGFDTLKPTEYPSVCLTEGSIVVPAGWEQRIALGLRGPRWRSRSCKILSHKFFPEAEYTIYVDGSVEMLVPPQEIVERFLRAQDVATFRHPERTCIYEEGKAVIRFRKAEPQMVSEQLQRYRQEGYPANNGLANCCVLVRRHTERIVNLNNLWWSEFCSGAPRDQLSFNYVCWKLGIGYAKIVPGNPFTRDCPFFAREPHRRSKWN